MFDGVCPVVNVPFKGANREVDLEGLGKITDYVIECGCPSVCLFAFNSEPHKLSFSEKLSTMKAFLKHVAGRVETLIGIVENSIADCTALAKAAKENGADAIILYPPSLSTPQGESLMNYFKTIADAVDIPIMIQDNPRSTGVTMSDDLLISAFKNIGQFKYIKVECPIPIRKMRRLIASTDGELKCYSGNGGIFAIDAFLSGASGIMPGVVLCGKFNEIYNLLKSGRLDEARDMFEKILPMTWYEDQSLEFYIACEKYLLKTMGIIEDDCERLPETTLSENEKTELMNLYKRL